MRYNRAGETAVIFSSDGRCTQTHTDAKRKRKPRLVAPSAIDPFSSPMEAKKKGKNKKKRLICCAFLFLRHSAPSGHPIRTRSYFFWNFNYKTKKTKKNKNGCHGNRKKRDYTETRARPFIEIPMKKSLIQRGSWQIKLDLKKKNIIDHGPVD